MADASGSDEVSALQRLASPLDRQLTWTEFPDQWAKSKRQRATSLRALAKRIQRTHGASKDELPWLKLAEFGEERTSKGSLRSNTNMMAIHGIELDYDDGDLTWDHALARLYEAGIAALLYTTRRHTSEKPRFRILIPTSRALPPEERARLVARAYGVLRGTIDGSSFTPSQSYYFGSAGGVHVYIELVDPPGGRYIDLADDLDAGALDRNGEPWGAEAVELDDEGNDDFGQLDCEPDVDRIRSALQSIPATRWDGDYVEWLSIGQALHDQFAGSAEGLALWDEVSQRCSTYDDRELEEKWESFGFYTGRPRTIGTLYRLAKLCGWVGRSLDANIARLNDRHALVMVQGKALVASERSEGGTDFSTVRDLHAYYANDRVAVTEKRTEAISERWMRHPDRRTYANGVEFAPGGAPAGALNLWRGWAVEPDAKASCKLFLRHILNVVCRGDRDHALYVMRWLAHMVQRPQDKPGVALVLRGAKGAGKDTVGEYLARMIGRRHTPTVANSEHIVGRFNRRMENALLLHVQEGSWAGDRKAEEVLKYLVTSEFVEIERKGIDSINVRSVLRLLISANADWVVPASHDERRWAVFETSDNRVGDDAYFAALWAEMNGGGPAGLLHYLQTLDLSGFNVRRAPETEGLRNQKLASLRGINKWWFDVLNTGELESCFADTCWEDERQSVGCEALRENYSKFVRSRRFEGDPLDSAAFGKLLREMVPGLERNRKGGRHDRYWVYELPPLATARQEFAAWLGSPIHWEAGSDCH